MNTCVYIYIHMFNVFAGMFLDTWICVYVYEHVCIFSNIDRNVGSSSIPKYIH